LTRSKNEENPTLQDKNERTTQPDWGQTISDAVAHVGEPPSTTGGDDDGAPRLGLAGRGMLAVAVVGITVVLSWSGWTLTHPTQLPPLSEQAYALRRSAGALIDEVQILRAEQGQLPSPEALADLLDDGLTYEPRGDGFRVENTDGDIVVVYDGTMPVEDWVDLGGYSLATVGPS